MPRPTRSKVPVARAGSVSNTGDIKQFVRVFSINLERTQTYLSADRLAGSLSCKVQESRAGFGSERQQGLA